MGKSAAGVSSNDLQDEVSSSMESKSYVSRPRDEPVLLTGSEQLMDVGNGAIDVNKCPEGVARAPIEANLLEEPLCSELVRSIEGTLGEDIKKLIQQSFGHWRADQKHVMAESYTKFCNERTHACNRVSDTSGIHRFNPLLAEEANTMMSQWLAREGCALEKAYSQWESQENEALGSVFALWLQRVNQSITEVLGRVKADLRSEAQGQFESWKMRERESLLADLAHVSAVKAGEQQSLHQDLVALRQQHRAEAAGRVFAEREMEALRRRAESAEAEAKRQSALLAARAQQQPVFHRHVLLSKRLRLDDPSHPVLGALDGDLFTKIKKARSVGVITAQEEEDMHRTRKLGNRAAHDPIGSFGTQAPRKEPETMRGSHACSRVPVDASSSDDEYDAEGFGPFCAG